MQGSSEFSKNTINEVGVWVITIASLILGIDIVRVSGPIGYLFVIAACYLLGWLLFFNVQKVRIGNDKILLRYLLYQRVIMFNEIYQIVLDTADTYSEISRKSTVIVLHLKSGTKVNLGGSYTTFWKDGAAILAQALNSAFSDYQSKTNAMTISARQGWLDERSKTHR